MPRWTVKVEKTGVTMGHVLAEYHPSVGSTLALRLRPPDLKLFIRIDRASNTLWVNRPGDAFAIPAFEPL